MARSSLAGVEATLPPPSGEDIARQQASLPDTSLFPDLRALLDPRQPYLIPVLLLLASRLYFWRLLPFASEDAYISFRYAKALVLGYGLVYNPGERVMGFTSPLWTLWSAVGYALLRDPVFWTRLWTLAADLVTLALFGGMLQRQVGRTAAWCFTFFFAAWTYFAAVAVSGLESSAMFSLIGLGAVLSQRRSLAAGPMLAALALIRPEGWAAATVLALGAGWRDRIMAGGLAFLGFLGLGLYYGSPIPQSLLAKAQVYGASGPLAGRHWWEWLSPFPMGRWPVTTEGSMLFAMAVVLAPAAVMGAAQLWRARSGALARAVAACLVVWLGYAGLGVAYFYWYLVVPLGGLAAMAAVGLPRIAKGVPVYASLALFVLGTWTIAPELYRARARAEWLGFGGAAEYLAHHARPGSKVMLEPIGMVGYRCQLVVIDEVGLVSPRVAKRRLQGPGWMTDIVAQEKPDWLVIRRLVLRDARSFAGRGAPFRNPAERDSLLAGYRIGQWIDPASGDNSLAVLERVR